jgi:simple sugar transport system permease protein
MSAGGPDRFEGLGRRVVRWLFQATVVERVVLAVVSLLLALLLGAFVVWVTGSDPVVFHDTLFTGAVGNPRNIALSLRQSTMLILAGGAVAVAFRAGIFNIGVQGQMVTGGFATALSVLGLSPHLPASTLGAAVVIILSSLVGMVAGGLYAVIPGLMKAYAEANEVVTTIMLNFIAGGVIYYVVLKHIESPDIAAEDVTPAFGDRITLPSIIFEDPSFSMLGFLVAVLAMVAMYGMLRYTSYGYELQTSGEQIAAAVYSGVDTKKQTVSTMFLSGVLAGLTGAVFVIMVLGLYRDPRAMPTFGFDAIAVSLIAGNNPLGVIPAGILFGGLSSAKVFIDIQLNISQHLVDGIVGLVVLFIAMPELFRMSYVRLRNTVPGRGGDADPGEGAE